MVISYGFFVLFTLVGIGVVWFSHRKKWTIDLTVYRHYTALIFNLSGIIYALFLGFITWDVWERYYDAKKTVQDEAHYLVELYRDSYVFQTDSDDFVREKIRAYLAYVIDKEWSHSPLELSFRTGSLYESEIWQAYYNLTPLGPKEEAWYASSIDKLNAFSGARMLRIFNLDNSVGGLRWTLLIAGGLILVTIPCFFRVDPLVLKLILTLFLANIIAFMLFIIYSLDNPFRDPVEIDEFPFKHAEQVIDLKEIRDRSA